VRNLLPLNGIQEVGAVARRSLTVLYASMSEDTQTKARKSLNRLLPQLDQKPDNLELINEIALTYNLIPSEDEIDHTLNYLEKAYALSKTIKTTHNLSWYLFSEWGDSTRAIEIQRECIRLNPRSDEPYFLLGYMLVEQAVFEPALNDDAERQDRRSATVVNPEALGEAIEILNEAMKFKESQAIVHSLGCAYFGLGEFERAQKYFERGSQFADPECISLYNLAITELSLNNTDKVRGLIHKLTEHEESTDSIDAFDIAALHITLDGYSEAVGLLITTGLEGLGFHPALGHRDLEYGLFRAKPDLFEPRRQEAITEYQEDIDEIESKHPNWDSHSEEDKLASLDEFRDGIAYCETLAEDFKKGYEPTIPVIMPGTLPCLLFGCPSCEHDSL
jgi:tetratricopeptide (TPR) repeat protein